MYEWVGVESKIEVVVLDVLAVVSLGTGEAEHPLLENRVFSFQSASAKQSAGWMLPRSRGAVLSHR